jgi:hypothetical protein
MKALKLDQPEQRTEDESSEVGSNNQISSLFESKAQELELEKTRSVIRGWPKPGQNSLTFTDAYKVLGTPLSGPPNLFPGLHDTVLGSSKGVVLGLGLGLGIAALVTLIRTALSTPQY